MYYIEYAGHKWVFLTLLPATEEKPSNSLPPCDGVFKLSDLLSAGAGRLANSRPTLI